MTNTCSFDFTGTTVLVTGGTSGIGHAVATAFADAGATVTVTGTKDGADGYDTDLARFVYRQMQTRDSASVDEVAASFATLDVLVNNAGATFPDGRNEWEPDAFAASLALNLEGAMRLTTGLHGALKASEAAGGGSVTNLVSMAAFRAVPMVPGYAASKAGLLALTRNLAVQWANDGIRVNAVAPGLIETPMTAPMKAFPSLLDAEVAKAAMKRMGTPEEIAAAVLFLSCSASAYTTGSVVAVDGGYLAM